MVSIAVYLHVTIIGLSACPGLALHTRLEDNGPENATYLENWNDLNLDTDENDKPPDLGPLRKLFGSTAAKWRESAPGAEKVLEIVMTNATRGNSTENIAPNPCKPAPPIKREGIPLYIFMMGVEGVGHHAVCPLIRNALNSAGYNNVGYLSHSATMHSKKHILTFAAWKNTFLTELKSWCPSGICLDCADSFPTGRPLSLGGAPDFPRILELHESGNIDMRMIALVRNPVDAVFSAVKRFGPNDPQLAFRYAESFLMHTTKSVVTWEAAHCERLITVQYETLIHEAKHYTKALGHLLGFSDAQQDHLPGVVRSYQHAVDAKNKKRNHNYRQYDPELYDIMNSWFAEREEFYWPDRRRLWHMHSAS